MKMPLDHRRMTMTIHPEKYPLTQHLNSENHDNIYSEKTSENHDNASQKQTHAPVALEYVPVLQRVHAVAPATHGSGLFTRSRTTRCYKRRDCQ